MAKAKTIAQRLKAAREKSNLSQSQAAKAWKLSKPTLQSWEQGTRNPAGLYLEKIESILKKAGV